MQIRRWIPVALASLTVLSPHSAVRAATLTVSAGGSISTALGAASSGDSVLVQEGSYQETVTLVSGVALLGGYDGTFTDRNPILHPTIIDGGGAAPTVISGPSVSASTLVDGFVITGGSGDGGAGILVNGGAPVFSNNDVRENRDGVAGGAHVHSGSTAMFIGNKFRNNRSAGSGGGMRVEDSAVTLIDNSFQANVAANAGGGLYLFQSDVQCSSTTFRSCHAGEGGGGMYLQRVGVGARIVDSDFLYCDATDMGGGVHAKNATEATLERSSFRQCRSANGGAVAVTAGADLTLVDCAIENCSADVAGGGIWSLEATVVMLGQGASESPSSSRIENCTAGTVGGGASVDSSFGNFDNVRVTNCSAPDWGGGVYVYHTPFTISLCVVEGCVSDEGGGLAFRTEFANLHERSTLLSSTIYGCSATGGGTPPAGGGVSLAAGGTDNVCTCIGNVVAGTLSGSAIRCRRGGSPAGAGTPVIRCSTFHADDSNPIAPADVVAGNRCDEAFNSGGSTINQEGIDPLYCQPIVDYRLQSGSPVVGNNCDASGKDDRGAQPDGNYCSGTTVSLEATTWGHLKAAYR